MTVQLETKDLLLRKAVQKDWHAMYRNLWRHAESARYMLWDVTEREADAPARMQRTIAFQRRHPDTWLVVEKATGQAIGFAGLEPLAPGVYEDGGIALGPAFVGRGYGRQVLLALVEYARGKPGAKQFVASCRAQNTASRRLQLACGFAFDHAEPRTDPRTGEAYTLEYYTLSLV